MTKADELWEKHLHNDMYATKAGFLAALRLELARLNGEIPYEN